MVPPDADWVNDCIRENPEARKLLPPGHAHGIPETV